KRRIGIDSIETVVLQLIGAHLVGETDAAAFLREVEHDAAAEIFEPPHRELKLIAAIAAPRAEHIAGKACRVEPHGNGVREIGLAYDDRGGIAADCVTEDDEARLRARIERNRRLARQR